MFNKTAIIFVIILLSVSAQNEQRPVKFVRFNYFILSSHVDLVRFHTQAIKQIKSTTWDGLMQYVTATSH